MSDTFTKDPASQQFYPNLEKGTPFGMNANYANIDAISPLVMPSTTIVVIKTPPMYDDNPIMKARLVRLLETCVQSADGIDIDYEMEIVETLYGQDGQSLKAAKSHKRKQPNPSTTLGEYQGNFVWNTMHTYMRDILSPDSGGFNAAGTAYENAPRSVADYSLTIALLQFDQSYIPENMIGGGFISNMFPTEPGGGFGLKVEAAESQMPDRTIPWTGIMHHTPTSRGLLIELAKALKLGQGYASYDTSTPFADFSQADSGLLDEIAKATA